jgi:tetratricopeptide (TPR) repeat protein/phage shock protein PspC (stress-responsive transcriptional regulator)
MNNPKSKPPKDPARSAAGSVSNPPAKGPLRKSESCAVLGGVCCGLGKSTPIPAWAWRLIFLATLPLFGLGAIAYALFYFLLPKDPAPRPTVPPLFRKTDWLTFGLAALVIFAGYVYTLAPDLTLEDSGELAVASHYAGVPHPPGYPVWTLYSWLFTVLVPFSNIAWRVALSSAFAGAMACGFIGLLASRGTSLILEGIDEFKDLNRQWENALCIAAGFVAALLIGFNGYMWSQSVIGEVYTLSVLSLTIVLALLFRWIYAPEQRHYLYWALFAFGICFTNHQTLIVATVGIEVTIALARPRIGRDLFLWNSIFFIVGLIAHLAGWITTFHLNPPLLWIFIFIGVSSIVIWAWLAFKTSALAENMWTGLCLGLCWIFGASFYFYMPLASMTNPPMNWGYARTWEGFLHALTRGQYERANPTGDPLRFMDQLRMYAENAVLEFNFVYLLIGLIPLVYLFFRHAQSRERRWIAGLSGGYALIAIALLIKAVFRPGGAADLDGLMRITVGIFCGYMFLLIAVTPFLFFRLMNRPERAWLGGLTSIWIGLAVLLLIILNPSADRQSQDLNRVFFTASHVMISLFIGYGVAIFGALVFTHYDRYRPYALYGSAVAAAIGLYAVSIVFQGERDSIIAQSGLFGLEPSRDSLVRGTALFSLALAAAAVGLFAVSRQRPPILPLLILFFFMPVKSVLSHWSDNEQRGHLFGFWFGHDMFSPPFDIYPEMSRDAILFGGTDPGRFCPTYMIFSESQIAPHKRRDPDFDRRDVYIITQNALADGTYLAYIRAHYFRSAQIDPPFFGEMLRTPHARARGTTNFAARLVAPIDRTLTAFGARVEQRRREQGVYPEKEIYTPSVDDHAQSMEEYFAEAYRRLQVGQLKPGEDVRVGPDGRLQVAGQVSVMAINSLLTKVIFDNNPDHEFYVEESFPLEWMFPHLTPFGVIMKINRTPVPEITESMVQQDHEFWSRYSERLIGNWITYDISIDEICDFIIRVYERRDFRGFTGDRRFIRDDQAQKSFSKLRSSIGGLYAWRLNHDRNPDARERMLKEADFAFRQAFAFCPYSPEAVHRLTNLLLNQMRLGDALRVAQTALRFDPDNETLQEWVARIQGAFESRADIEQMQERLGTLEQSVQITPTNASAVFDLASLYIEMNRTSDALHLFDQLVEQPGADLNTVLSVANAYAQLQDGERLETALQRLVVMTPDSPEAWYDLASTQAILGKYDQALQSLARALDLSNARLAADPRQPDLRHGATTNVSFLPLRNRPEFQRLLGSDLKF